MSMWTLLEKELSQWHRAGMTPCLWWRDDDAVSDSANLHRLSSLSIDFGIPLNLAVIPLYAEPSLLKAFAGNRALYALQHGYSHNNYAPPGERKMELGKHRAEEMVCNELRRGLQILSDLLAERFFPVLVPPWNRISEDLHRQLGTLGFKGFSTLGPRPNKTVHGLLEMNVHIDLIDWKQGKFAGEDNVLEQLISRLEAGRCSSLEEPEPIGIMSHHLVHDDKCWEFLLRLFEYCHHSGVEWTSVREVFTRS